MLRDTVGSKFIVLRAALCRLSISRQTTVTETLDKALLAITRYNGVNIYANVNTASPSLICNQKIRLCEGVASVRTLPNYVSGLGGDFTAGLEHT